MVTNLSQAIDTTVNIYVESVQGLKPSLASPNSPSRSSGAVTKSSASLTPLLPRVGGSYSATSSAANSGVGGGLNSGLYGRLCGDEGGSSTSSGVPGVSSRGNSIDSMDGSGDSSDDEPVVRGAEAESGAGGQSSTRGSSGLLAFKKTRKFSVVATNLDTKLQRFVYTHTQCIMEITSPLLSTLN